jgi:hypothetical protein
LLRNSVGEAEQILCCIIDCMKPADFTRFPHRVGRLRGRIGHIDRPTQRQTPNMEDARSLGQISTAIRSNNPMSSRVARFRNTV